jgi:FkbM family methyltransferase
MTTTIIPVHPVGVQLIVEGDAIARMMLNGKAWEPETRAKWQDLCMRSYTGYAVVDVGAYTGVYAIAAALMGKNVWALEPHPSNYARLINNAALNSMRIVALPMAASSSKGTKTLHMRKQIDDLASFEGRYAFSEVIEVPTIRIDDLKLATQWHRIGLLKIDVEHHEVHVLQGATKTLREHRPVVVVETLDDEAKGAVGLLMFEAQYRLHSRLDGRNMVFVHKGHPNNLEHIP